ncbi:retrovirus-related pol polyprotein from transposon TNT 1-94 [Tanacetum coccineum]
MAYSSTSSNFEISTDSNCLSSCLENVKILKEQNEQLLNDLRTSKLKAIAYKTCSESVEARLLVYKKNESVYEEDIKVLKCEIHLRKVAITVLRRKLELAQKQKDEIQLTLENIETSSKSLSQLIDCQIVDKCKTEEFVNEPIVSEPTVKKPAVETSKAKDNPQVDLQDQGVIDSGCSRHMTRNISYLTDFEEIDGGYVAFRVPIKNNMYSVDLKNIVPKGGLTCLFAKATSDESKLWHRRLGHINFKTMNKLVKGNLVRDGVAERKNRTLTKAARTMLADSKLPTTFWAKVVNTSCYVQNRVLVTKPHNKTPYELFLGRKPALGFMRPFGCPVTILNTIDHLGKFDGKADEGFFVGYSINSKARMETVPGKDYILLTLWTVDPPFSQSLKNSQDDGSKPSSDDEKKVDEDPRKDSKSIDQEKDDNVNSTNNVNAASTNEVNVVGGKTSIELPDDPNMPALEDYSIFDLSSDDQDNGAEADMNNLDTTIQVSPIPTTRIHKDHPVEQIIGDLNSAPQTRRMTKNLEEHEEIDYDEVFSLVARIEAIRLFLAYASFKDFMVYQMDVKSAFLYGKIEEEVYVCQPPGFEDPDFPDRVYKVVSELVEKLLSTLKLPVLKTGDYNLWSMRMEQYLTHTDYALWELIVNGDALAIASASSEGPIPPKTAE